MFSWKGGGEAVSSLSSLYCTAAALRLSDWLQATGVGLGGGEELREEALQMQLFPSPRSYCGRRSWCSFCSFTQWWWSWSWSWWWWQILWSTIWKLMHDHVGLFYIILLTRAMMKMTLSKFFVGKSFAFTEKKKHLWFQSQHLFARNMALILFDHVLPSYELFASVMILK